MDLVEIAAPEFDVEFEIAYAIANNLTGEPIYRRAACYLHADAAKLLDRAIALAAELGLRLKIFDAFRPVEAPVGVVESYSQPRVPCRSAQRFPSFARCRYRSYPHRRHGHAA